VPKSANYTASSSANPKTASTSASASLYNTSNEKSQSKTLTLHETSQSKAITSSASTSTSAAAYVPRELFSSTCKRCLNVYNVTSDVTTQICPTCTGSTEVQQAIKQQEPKPQSTTSVSPSASIPMPASTSTSTLQSQQLTETQVLRKQAHDELKVISAECLQRNLHDRRMKNLSPLVGLRLDAMKRSSELNCVCQIVECKSKRKELKERMKSMK
jgi:hypothetical protein